MPFRTCLSIAVILTVVIVTVPPVPAQETPQGALFFTDEVLSASATTNAGTVYRYAANTRPPTDGDAGQAYGPSSAFALRYTDAGPFFDFTAPKSLNVAGPVTAKLFIGCDAPIAFRPAVPGGLSPPIGVSLVYDGEVIAAGSAEPSAPVCLPGDVLTVEVVMEVEGTMIEAGEILTTALGLFHSGVAEAAAKTFHILTENVDTASGLFGPSLPALEGVPAPPAVEVLGVATPDELVPASAGSDATFGVTVTNEGDEAADFTLEAQDVPDGFTVTFEPAQGTVDPGQAVESSVTVTVPSDASAGDYPFMVLASGPNGGNASAQVTLAVSEASPSPTPTSGGPTPSATPPSPDAGTTTTDATGTEDAAAGQEDAGAESPGLGAALVVVGVAAAGMVARRRRRVA